MSSRTPWSAGISCGNILNGRPRLLVPAEQLARRQIPHSVPAPSSEGDSGKFGSVLVNDLVAGSLAIIGADAGSMMRQV